LNFISYILKKLLIVIIILTGSLPSFAESNIEKSVLKKLLPKSLYSFNHTDQERYWSAKADSILIQEHISFGVKLGINRARMNFNKGFPFNDYPFKQPWKSGFTIGGFLNIPLNEKYSIHQEYNYTKIRGDYIPFEATIHLHYLSIPVLIKYSLTKDLQIIAGPQFDLLITGKQTIGNLSEDITKSTEERNIGINLGLQYYVNSSLFIEGRFMHGLNDIGLWQRNGIREFKHEVFLLSIGYIF